MEKKTISRFLKTEKTIGRSWKWEKTNSRFWKWKKHKQRIFKNGKNKQQILKTGKKQTADFKIGGKNRKEKKQKKTDKKWKIKIEKNRKKTEKYLFPTLQTQAGTVTCNINFNIYKELNSLKIMNIFNFIFQSRSHYLAIFLLNSLFNFILKKNISLYINSLLKK